MITVHMLGHDYTIVPIKCINAYCDLQIPMPNLFFWLLYESHTADFGCTEWVKFNISRKRHTGLRIQVQGWRGWNLLVCFTFILDSTFLIECRILDYHGKFRPLMGAYYVTHLQDSYPLTGDDLDQVLEVRVHTWTHTHTEHALLAKPYSNWLTKVRHHLRKHSFLPKKQRKHSWECPVSYSQKVPVLKTHTILQMDNTVKSR